MSLQIYPVRPIVTTDAELLRAYNQHPTSITYVSACITPSEAEELLAQGAKFESVHLLDGAGEELFADTLEDGAPDIRRVNSAHEGATIDTLHRMLRAELQAVGMG